MKGKKSGPGGKSQTGWRTDSKRQAAISWKRGSELLKEAEEKKSREDLEKAELERRKLGGDRGVREGAIGLDDHGP